MRFLLVSVLLLFAAACSEPQQKKERSEIQAVSLSPALTELIFHLGKGNMLAGRSDACNYPEQVKILPVAGSFGIPAVETVLRLAPDLILTNALVNPRQKKLFEQAGIRVILKPCDTLEDYREWVGILGEQLCAEKEADGELARLNRWLEKNQTRKNSGKRALLLLWDDPVMAAGAGTLPDSAMRLAGLENVLAKEKGYVKCSAEFLLRAEPDLLIWAVEKPYGLAAEIIRKMNVKTVVDESFDYDAILRPGPRFTDGVDALRRAVQ